MYTSVGSGPSITRCMSCRYATYFTYLLSHIIFLLLINIFYKLHIGHEDIPLRRERKKEQILTPAIGNACRSDNNCKIPETVCAKIDEDYEGKCLCKTGLQFSSTSKQCIPGN